MIRWATVTDVTAKGVWVVSAWLTGRTGPIPVSGSPAVGDPVLIMRTDEGELAAVRGGDTRYVDAIKSDVKAIAAASTDFADFKTRMAAW